MSRRAAHAQVGSFPRVSVTRVVRVPEVCASGERSCSDGACSESGVCKGDTSSSSGAAAAAVNSPPTLAFDTELWPSRVSVKRGWGYVKCATGTDPTTSSPCEPGAYAADSEDGSSIASQVLICPPAGCLDTGCAGHRFFEKDLLACGIDTSTADIGTLFQLDYVVYDSNGANATLTRLITVVTPCEPGEFYCDGACSQADCDALNALPQQGPQAPVLTLLPTRLLTGNNVTTSNVTTYTPYGQ